MNNHKVLSFIGICMKAGKLVSGEFSVDKAVKGGQAYLVLVAGDVSPGSKKHYTDMCRSAFSVPKRNWEGRWAKNIGLPWLCWMRTWPGHCRKR